MRPAHALIVLMAALLPQPAEACAIIAAVGGGLAEVPGSDGHQLSSGVGLALSGTVSILSIGPGTVRVDPPVIVNPPAGFNANALAEVAYQGAGLGGGISQGFTSAQTQFSVPNTPLDAIIVTIDNRITSPNGFPGGTYTTTTVVTCTS